MPFEIECKAEKINNSRGYYIVYASVDAFPYSTDSYQVKNDYQIGRYDLYKWKNGSRSLESVWSAKSKGPNVWKIRYYGDNNYRILIDGTQRLTCSDNEYTSGYIVFGNWGGPSDVAMRYYYIRVRKYTFPEPTVTSIEAEQAAP